VGEEADSVEFSQAIQKLRTTRSFCPPGHPLPSTAFQSGRDLGNMGALEASSFELVAVGCRDPSGTREGVARICAAMLPKRVGLPNMMAS
jgi:hypothetical protein